MNESKAIKITLVKVRHKGNPFHFIETIERSIFGNSQHCSMTTFNYLGSYTTNKINILLILTSSTHYNDSGTMFFIISEYFFFRDTFAQDTRIFDIRKLSGMLLFA